MFHGALPRLFGYAMQTGGRVFRPPVCGVKNEKEKEERNNED